MPSVDSNRQRWGEEYQWVRGGDEWSVVWGSTAMEWYATILPRIHRFVPTDSILEIACGYGRWTQYLKDLCRHLTALDLTAECVDACRERFRAYSHIEYYHNDGKSLAMIPDASVDFVFSFDSLVHADSSVMEAYIAQFPRILKQGGAAFLHHSNLGQYAATYTRIRRIPKLEGLLRRVGLLEKGLSWRDFSVSAALVAELAETHGLQCVSQETLTWATKRAQIDCFSVLIKSDATPSRERRTWQNPHFMREARYQSRLSYLYAKKE